MHAHVHSVAVIGSGVAGLVAAHAHSPPFAKLPLV
jgi:predicted NAD/FAD-binding protein